MEVTKAIKEVVRKELLELLDTKRRSGRNMEADSMVREKELLELGSLNQTMHDSDKFRHLLKERSSSHGVELGGGWSEVLGN